MHVTQPICFKPYNTKQENQFLFTFCVSQENLNHNLLCINLRNQFFIIYILIDTSCTSHVMYFKILFTWVHFPIEENKNYLSELLIYFKALQWHKTILIYCIGDCLIDRCLTLIFIRNIYLYILLITATDVYMWPVADKSAVSIEHIVPKCHYVWSEIFLSEI